VASILWVGVKLENLYADSEAKPVPALEDSGSRITEEELDSLISDDCRLRGWKPAAGCNAASDRPVLQSTIFNHR
jgi:hypothetical protein